MAKAAKKPQKSLTPKEKAVLEFLEHYFSEYEMAPSYKEIKEHFGYASYYSVQRYLKKLEEKSYISLGSSNEKRAISLIAGSDMLMSLEVASKSIANKKEEVESSQPPGLLSLPLLGKVAAGAPIEHITHDEYLDVPENMVRTSSDSFVLQVEGSSMIDDGIFEGDFLIVEKSLKYNKGDTVVAMVEEEATVKNLFMHSNSSTSKLSSKQKSMVKSGKTMELQPANQQMESMFFHPGQVEIQGKVVGLIRKYH